MLKTLACTILALPLAAQDVHYVLQGPGGTTRFGSIVSTLGDVNGDGVSELLLGFPSEADGGGRIVVVSGRTGVRIRSLEGGRSMKRLGSVVEGVGDVDGDGIEDIGSQALIGDEGPHIVIYSGASGDLLWTKPSPLALVSSLTGIGDLDGDGRGEVIFSDPQRFSFPEGTVLTGPGIAEVLSGADGSVVSSTRGPSLGAGWFANATGTGDIDGDGVLDYALSGGSTTLGQRLVAISGATGLRLGWWEAGFSAERVGDLDGDGRDDLVIAGSNRARAVSTGSFGDIWYAFREFPQLTGIVPAAISATGDVDVDGVPDVLVGYPDVTRSAQGAIWHQGPGRASVVSGVNGTLVTVFTGQQVGEEYGRALGSLGDINGDGVLDIWVAAPQFRVDGRRVGRIEVRSALELFDEPTSYCVSGRNVSGTEARLTTSGSTSIAANDLVFHVTGGVPLVTAILLTGRAVSTRFVGGGTLCIADEVVRVRSAQLDGQGALSVPLDVNNLPPAASIAPGDTWSFQVWYRSGPNPGIGGYQLPVNLSDAVRVPFRP